MSSIKPLKDRIPFVYIEHSEVSVKGGSLVSFLGGVEVTVPVGDIAVLLLGPGTRPSHAAMKICADHHAMIEFVGEDGFPVYAVTNPYIARGDRLIAQAEANANPKKRLRVAQHLYNNRFKERINPSVEITTLLGLEGSKSKLLYKTTAEQFGLIGFRRQVGSNDPVNRCISYAANMMYSAATCAIFCAGFTPSIGFLHEGREKPFACDLADTYRFDVTIPIAMKVAREQPENMYREVRKAIKEEVAKRKLLDQLIKDAVAAVGAA